MLGILIIGAVGAVYISSKRTYSERDTLSLVQENGRIAIQLLEYGISPAGYPAVDHLDPFLHNATKDGVVTVGEVSLPADSIGIKFFPKSVGDQGGYQQDCLGSKNHNGTYIENIFSIKDGKLYCEGSSNPGRPQPIAEGVESMDIEYGVLTKALAAEDKDFIQMFNATQINADGTWKQVISVKIGLNIESPKETDPFEGKARTFSTTIPLRNRIPLLEQDT